MKTRIITMLTALLLSAGAFAQSGEGITSTIRGDVNGDGIVNTADIVALVNIIMNISSEEANPSNSLLSSRLKDKDGNIVFLEGIKDSSGNWVMKYDYNEDGSLSGFYMNYGNFSNAAFKVNGLSYSSTYNLSKYTIEMDAKATMNDDGLIKKLHYNFKYYNSIGNLTQSGWAELLFSYSAERQLTRIDVEDGYEERYKEDGSIKVVEPDEEEQYSLFIWKDDNLVNDGDGRHYNTEYEFGNEVNVVKQWLLSENNVFSLGGFKPLLMIGLYGVGSANFPSKSICTLNEDGTIAKEKHVKGDNGEEYTYQYRNK